MPKRKTVVHQPGVKAPRQKIISMLSKEQQQQQKQHSTQSKNLSVDEMVQCVALRDFRKEIEIILAE